MFRKNKTTAKAASGNDLNTLLDVFDKIISGEISHTGESPADITLFENPEVANKFNEVVVCNFAESDFFNGIVCIFFVAGCHWKCCDQYDGHNNK